MKNLFCSHTPSEENIKEVANELGLFQNVHLLACDINDVKVILNGATNYILVEGMGNGSGRLSNALEDAVIQCCGIAKGYNLFSADKLLLHIECNSVKPLLAEELWEKFYKVDKARTREYGGNGIGLSIVKAIMDSFGKGYGAINHTNGVEFWFELDMK